MRYTQLNWHDAVEVANSITVRSAGAIYKAIADLDE
jgi:hypothetical protein